MALVGGDALDQPQLGRDRLPHLLLCLGLEDGVAGARLHEPDLLQRNVLPCV